MNNKFIYLLSLFMAIYAYGLFTKSTNKKKVACIGNSITKGDGIEKKENTYPEQLQKMLGEKWEVENFGVNGATLLKKGDFPYVETKEYQKALKYQPDIVVIKLGTNDTKPQNWKGQKEFEKDYLEMIHTIKKLKFHPEIYLCFPVPAYSNNWGISESVIQNEVIPSIKNIALLTGTKIIDLHTPFSGKPDYFFDKIHPNEEGANLIAEIIFKNIKSTYDRKKNIER